MALDKALNCLGQSRILEIKNLRPMLWYWAVSEASGIECPSEMELKFEPLIRNDFNPEEFEVTNKYRRYKNGKNAPSEELVSFIEGLYPSTRYYLDHPFWHISNPLISDLHRLNVELELLRPEVKSIVFGGSCENEKISHGVAIGNLDKVKALSRCSDLDALAALIFMIRECDIVCMPGLKTFYERPAFAVLKRVVISPPFVRIAGELFEFIWKSFLPITHTDPTYQRPFEDVRIGDFIILGRCRLYIIDRFKLLKKFEIAPPSCLYIAEKYLDLDLLFSIKGLIDAGHENRVKKIPEIMNLRRALRKWENNPDYDRCCRS